jgi:hypothetical protein
VLKSSGRNDREVMAEALDAFAAYCLYVTQDIKDTLHKAEILHWTGQLTMFDQKSSVTCHAREECFDWMHCVRVMEASYIDSAINSPNKLFKAGIPRYHHCM